MNVTITDSGMEFGEYAKEDIFELEKVLNNIKFGHHVCKVEFIVRISNGKKTAVAFVEAKSSIPKASDQFFKEICLKMQHSLIIWFTAVCGRHDKLTDQLPVNLKSTAHLKLPIKLFLVIPTIPNDYLAHLTDKLRLKLSAEKNIWAIKDCNIFVINESKAEKYGLSGHICT